MLLTVLVVTLAAGVGSVWLAALISLGVMARHTQHMLSLAAGALLATAFLHLLPEAFESQAGAHELFLTLLVAVLFFFLLDKAELWHHGHEHHHGPAVDPGSAHHHGHDHHPHHHPAEASGPRPLVGGWTVLAGDSVHCFGDGLLIASALVADWKLGLLAALAVVAHEVPHHIGDLVVLRGSTGSRRAALIKVSMAGAVTALGGMVGWTLVGALEVGLPYFLTVASASFLYVALADLIPQLQRPLSARDTLAQLAWLAVGVGLVALISRLAGHAH